MQKVPFGGDFWPYIRPVLFHIFLYGPQYALVDFAALVAAVKVQNYVSDTELLDVVAEYRWMLI